MRLAAIGLKEEDSARSRRFPFREGDVVVSARSKSGTTWMQQICLSLVHGSAALPSPVGKLSPWVDWLTESEAALFTRLNAQPGRRVLKTHTPLDGVVLDPRASYVVVVRDPLDMAVSLYHQGNNLDRERLAELTGRAAETASPRPPLREWLVGWTLDEADPMESMDSLAGVVHHAAQRVPDHRSVLKDPTAFFRRGSPGAGREILGDQDVAVYERRVRELLAAEEVDDPRAVLGLLNVG